MITNVNDVVRRPAPIRVARVIARMNVGGPARHVSWLSAALNDERFQTTLITGRVAPGEEDMTSFAGSLGVEPVVLGDMTRALSWRDAIVVARLFRIFRRIQPDIIHTHTAKAGTVGRIAGVLYRVTTRRRVRFVHTFHGHVFHGYYGRAATALFLAIERFLARFTDAIVVLSPRQRDEINGTYRIGRLGQFVIVPLGLDLSGFTGDRRPHEGFVAAIVGRLTEVKGHDFFLRAFAAWSDPAGRALVIGDGHLRPSLERTAAALGIADRVTFTGMREDPESFYRDADLLVLTSRNEGTPLSILEAMADGVPVLATAVGGVPDLLGEPKETADGFTIAERGVMIAYGDVDGFVAAMRRLSSDRELRERLASAARAWVFAHHDKQRMVRDVTELYLRLLNR